MATKPPKKDSLGVPNTPVKAKSSYPPGGDFNTTFGGLPLRGKVSPVKTNKRGIVFNPSDPSHRLTTGKPSRGLPMPSKPAPTTYMGIDPPKVKPAGKTAPMASPVKRMPGTTSTDVALAGSGARGSAGGGKYAPSKKTAAKKNYDPFGALGRLGGSVGTMLDPSLASSIAGGTYDPVINDLQNQLNMLPGQTKQNKADITNWMDQVLGSLATGQKRSDTGYDTATHTAGDTASGIIASLGGSDNPGGRMVGDSGANAAAMMQALKGNNDAFLNDMKPILDLEKSGQLNAQDATASSLSRDLMSQMASARGQKSGLDAQTQMQISQINNGLAQQRFGNMFGVDQASLMSQVAAGQSKLTSAYKTAQIAKILNGLQNPSPAKGSFGATTASDRLSMAQKINSAITQLKGQNPNIGVAPVMQQINSLIGSAGWNLADPGVTAWRNSLLPGIGINPTTQAWNAG